MQPLLKRFKRGCFFGEENIFEFLSSSIHNDTPCILNSEKLPELPFWKVYYLELGFLVLKKSEKTLFLCFTGNRKVVIQNGNIFEERMFDLLKLEIKTLKAR